MINFKKPKKKTPSKPSLSKIPVLFAIFFLFISLPLFPYVPGDYETAMGGKANVKRLWQEFKNNISRYEEYSTNVAEYSSPVLQAISQFIVEMDERIRGAVVVDQSSTAAKAQSMVQMARATRTSVTILNQLILLMDTALLVGRYDVLATLSPAIFYLNPILSIELQKKMDLPTDYDGFANEANKGFFKKRYGDHVAPKVDSRAKPRSDVALVCVGTTAAPHCFKQFQEDKVTGLWLQKERIMKDALAAIIKTPLSGPSMAITKEEYEKALRGPVPDLAEMFQSATTIADLGKMTSTSISELTSQTMEMERELRELRTASTRYTEGFEFSPNETQKLFNLLKVTLDDAQSLMEIQRIKNFQEYTILKRYFDDFNRILESNKEFHEKIRSITLEDLNATESYNAFLVATAILRARGKVKEGDPILYTATGFAEMLVGNYAAQEILKQKGINAAELSAKLETYGGVVCDVLGEVTGLIPGCPGFVKDLLKQGGKKGLGFLAPIIAKAVVKRYDEDEDGRLEKGEYRQTIKNYWKEKFEEIKAKKEGKSGPPNPRLKSPLGRP